MKLEGIERYWNAIHALQEDIIATQSDALDAAAALMVSAIKSERSIFLFGTGHSHMLAEEGHYRAGSLVNFIPILMSGIMLHEKAQLSGQLERTAGIAAPLLDSYQPQSGDVLCIFSNSGVNSMPVEMALAAKERRIPVISVSSFAYADVAPLSASGRRLHDIADVAIDNRIVPGDAMVALEGLPWKVAPASTIAGSFILNGLVAEVAYRLCQEKLDVPVFVSSNMTGASESNRVLLEKWGKRNPHL